MMPDLSSAAQSLLDRAVGSSVNLRGPRARWAEQGSDHKEWLHFTIHAGALDLVVNFSFSSDSSGAGGLAVRVGRVGCLVRHERWYGDIDAHPERALRGRAGECRLRIGPHRLDFRDGGFDLAVHLPEAQIDLQLRLEPRAFPAQINNFQIEGSPQLNWSVVPKLRASGWLTLRGQHFPVEDALAYHDHNWGGFRWGGNFSWEWGYALSTTQPWSLVFARLSDRGHLTDLMRGLFVWRGTQQHRVFGAREVSVRHHGLWRGPTPLTLPRVMALLNEGHTSDVPARFEVSARRGEDALDLELVIEDVAQVAIPNDQDLGLTIINECCGRFSVAGRLAGDDVAFDGRTIFEFLGD